MPDPFTIGSAVVGGGLNLFAGLSAAAAARRRAALQAALLENNAELADYLGADARARGSVEEGIARLKGGQKMGAQKTAYAASGVDVQSGSAVDVLGSTALMSEFDAQMAKSNAAREAWGYGTEATQMRWKAKLARAGGEVQGDESTLAGLVNAGRGFVPLLSIGGPGVNSGANWAAGDYLGGASYT